MARDTQTAAQAANTPGGRPRILRIGVVLGGRIVEEQLIRDRRRPVTIGQSAKNTVSIPAPELPRSWTLFQEIGGRYVLNATEAMDGRVAEGTNVQTLAQLKSSGAAQKINGGWQIPLPETARGKVVLGEMTLLFQFVAAPPIRPKPQLPRSVRGRLLDRIDPWMAVILLVSFMAHTGFGLYLYYADMPAPPQPDEVPDRFAKGILERPIVLEKKKVEATSASSTVAEAPSEGIEEAPQKKEDGGGGGDRKKEPKEEPGGGGGPPDQAAVAQKVGNTALFKVLGAKTQGGSGRFVDVTGGKNTTGDLDKGLANVGRSGASLGLPGDGAGGLGGGTRGGGTGEIGTGKHVGVSGPSGAGAGAGRKIEEEIRVDVSTGRIEDIEAGGLDPNKVAATIKSRYAGGVRQCYQRALKSNPKLQGKLVVGFTVGPAGNVTKVEVRGFDAEVDDCVAQQARRWRFDKPEDGTAEFEFPFILRPGN